MKFDTSSKTGRRLDITYQGRKKQSFLLRYRFVVRAGRFTLRRGWLRVSQKYYRSTRTPEGTDAFINYCINENRPIYSSGGRLYCESPSYTVRKISFHKRKPRFKPGPRPNGTN